MCVNTLTSRCCKFSRTLLTASSYMLLQSVNRYATHKFLYTPQSLIPEIAFGTDLRFLFHQFSPSPTPPYFKPKNKPQRVLAPELTKKGRISISLFFGTTLIMSSSPALIHCRKNFILFLRSLHHRKSISKFLRIPYRPLPWPGRHSGSCRHRDHSRRRKRETEPHRFHRFLSLLW